jgi:hypothetical protein
LSLADLSNLTFVAGPSGPDSLKIGATDGLAFSGWHQLGDVSEIRKG